MWLHKLCQNAYYAGSIESVYCVKSNDIEKMCQVTYFLLQNILCDNAWWKGTHFCCGSSLPYYPRVSLHTEKTLTARQLIFTFSIKTQSSGGFRSSQRALWPWQTWKYHWPLSAIKSDNLKKQHHQELPEATRARLKLKIQLLADFCPPGMRHKIRWYGPVA